MGDVIPVSKHAGVVLGGGGHGRIAVGSGCCVAGIPRFACVPCPLIGGVEIDGLAVQGLHHRLRGAQDAEVDSRQAHRYQQAEQYQPPQGVLDAAGDLLPEHLAQDQQGGDQNG